MGNLMKILKKYYLDIIGTVAGGLGGYLYYVFIGCGSGTCPIQSNMLISILFGALIGLLIFDLFRNE